jgi:GxxExxY protein
MNTDKNKLNVDDGLNRLTEQIIGCAFTVSNALGHGFLEKVYENALVHEFRKAGLTVEQQCMLKVFYDEVVVGEYIADLLVEEQVLVELKAIKTLDKIHMAQCMNYLKATRKNICLLLNFGNSRLEIKRIVL